MLKKKRRLTHKKLKGGNNDKVAPGGKCSAPNWPLSIELSDKIQDVRACLKSLGRASQTPSGDLSKLFPITYSVPEDKMVTSVPPKQKILSSLIPGERSTYVFNTEEEYYNEYKSSIFAKTIQKGGWDCLRHYEIILNGCIPYFPNIEKCPVNTMALFPKDLTYEANALYDKIKDKDINNLTEDEKNSCNALSNKFLEYMRKHLTTAKMAQYVLEKSNRSNASKVLFLSKNLEPDYLRCLSLIGFKQILGDKCHDYPKITHIYKSNDIDYKALYGKGITYTNILEQSLHNDAFDSTIEDDIKNKRYDLIIYGSWHKGTPYYDLVTSVYKPDEIVLLCNEDIHECNFLDWLIRGHYTFVREL